MQCFLGKENGYGISMKELCGLEYIILLPIYCIFGKSKNTVFVVFDA